MSAGRGFFPRDEYFMRLALREAERALEHDDVPIGAVLVHASEVLAAARNERELRRDPTAHAEVLALRVFHDHLVRHVVSGQRARGEEKQQGGDQGEEANGHWVTVGCGVYERRNNLTIGKL